VSRPAGAAGRPGRTAAPPGRGEEAVLAPAVRARFDETFAAHGGVFDQPVRIDCFGPAA